MMAAKIFRESLLTLSVFAVMLTFLGCAGTMSLEEAKKVSVEMSGASFKPPPRRVDDVLSIVQPKGRLEKLTEQLQEKLLGQPPETDDNATLAYFYYKRGNAALQSSRLCEGLPDLRKAFYHAEKTGMVSDLLLTDLGRSEMECSNVGRGIELLMRAAKQTVIFGGAHLLVPVYLAVGDIESAISAKNIVVNTDAKGYIGVRSFGITGQNPRESTTDQRFIPARVQYLVLHAQGKYQEAEYYIRQCIEEKADKSLSFHNQYESLPVDIDWAFNLSMQGRFREAEVEARKAIEESIVVAGKPDNVTADAIGVLANIMLRQGRFEEAEKLGYSRIKILDSIGVTIETKANSSAHIALADTFVMQRKYASAAREYDLVRNSMKKNRYLYDNNLSRNRNLILTLIKLGRTDEALKMIEPARDAAVRYFGEKSQAEFELLGLRGMARLSRLEYTESLSDFSVIVPVLIEQKHLGFSDRMFLEAYMDVLSRIQGTPLEAKLGDKAATIAFNMAGLLGSRTVESAMGESSARAAAAYDPNLTDLVRREQDMKKQIAGLEMTLSKVMALPEDQRSSRAIRQIQEYIDTLTRAVTALQKEINQRFPKYAEFIKPKPVPAPDVQRILRSGEALLSIYTTDEKTFVWAIPRQGKILFHAAPLGREELGKIVTNLRKPLDANSTTLGAITDFDTALAYSLYVELLKPVAAGWRNASDLIVVNTGPLGQLPLSLLPTELVKLEVEKELLFSRYQSVPWLVRKVSVTAMPSVSSLATLRSVPEGDLKRKAFVGFGDPIFSKAQLAQMLSQTASMNAFTGRGKGTMPLIASRGMKVQVRGIRITEKGNLDKQEIISSQLSQLHRLPDTTEEIRSTAQILNADMARDVFLGKEASEHRVKTMDLSDRKIISFATHALIPGDLDGLDQPALALSSPEVTGEKEDGLLTMEEIMKLKLNADWLVLSACNTGASQGAGQEAVSGLGRAFFYAGTRSLLVSQWPVETTSAKKLVTGIFEAQKNDVSLARSSALRKSMINLMDNERFVDPATGKIVASYAHPIFWAPFTVVGETGKQ